MIKYFQNKLNFRQNNPVAFNYEKFVKSPKFRSLKNKKLKNNGPTQQTISIFYDLANYLLNQEKRYT